MGDVDPGALQQRCRAPVLLVEQGEEEVLRLDESAVSREGEALGIRERLLDISHGAGTHECIPLQGSGTFAVEAAIANVVPKEGHVLVPVNGANCMPTEAHVVLLHG
jgi:hypothetical protein